MHALKLICNQYIDQQKFQGQHPVEFVSKRNFDNLIWKANKYRFRIFRRFADGTHTYIILNEDSYFWENHTKDSRAHITHANIQIIGFDVFDSRFSCFFNMTTWFFNLFFGKSTFILKIQNKSVALNTFSLKNLHTLWFWSDEFLLKYSNFDYFSRKTK